MKINKSRRGSSRNISRRKLVKRTHKKSLFRLKKYNKNIKRRKHYTRKVNRCKCGGKLFNFSFPVKDKQVMDGNNTDSKVVSKIVAGGVGYVTKSGLLNEKDRAEELIVYEVDDEPDHYCIARCLMGDCEIAASGTLNTNRYMTEYNMEKPIKLRKEYFKVEKIDGKLLAQFKTLDNDKYTIKAEPTEGHITINGKQALTLHTFFNSKVTAISSNYAPLDSSSLL